MDYIRVILEDAYQFAELDDNAYSDRSGIQENWIQTIIEKTESQKAVVAVLNNLPCESDPKLFLNCYSKNLLLDFNQNTDIKEVHLRYWNELLDSLL